MWKMISSIALAAMLAACGSVGSDGSPGPAAASDSGSAPAQSWTATAPDINGARAAEALQSGEVDALDEFDPNTMAADGRIKRIVVGTVAGFASGPKLFAEMIDDPWAVPTVVMKVKVQQDLKGATPPEGYLYVQVMGIRDHRAAAAALPPGSLIALYLEPAPQADPSVKVNDAAAGHPAGTPLWQTDAQAFVVADGPTGGIVLPAVGEVHPEQTFASRLPRGASPRPR